MRLRWLVWIMNLLYVPVALSGLAAAFAGWEALHDKASWGTVGQLALLASVFLVPALLLDRFGRRRGNGRSGWWLDDQLTLDDLRWKRPEVAEFGALATVALKQTVASLDAKTDVSATDEMLRDYWTVEGVDWREVWFAASEQRSEVPRFGTAPYWGPKGFDERLVPVSVLAFCEKSLRVKFASRPTADRPRRELLVSDPSPEVARAAREAG